MHKKSITARARPKTSLRELTALPRLPSWNKGDILLREEKKRREGRGEEGWESRGGNGRGSEWRGPPVYI